jgi:hypothetical protein
MMMPWSRKLRSPQAQLMLVDEEVDAKAPLRAEGCQSSNNHVRWLETGFNNWTLALHISTTAAKTKLGCPEEQKRKFYGIFHKCTRLARARRSKA